MKLPTAALALMMLVVHVGCNDDDKKKGPSSDMEATADLSDPQLESMSLMHLRECNVLGAGTYNDGTIEDDFDRCAIKCMLDTPCADLKLQLCSGTERDPKSAYVKCTNACLASTTASQFRCSDGSTIPHSFVCDLLEDCPDGEDEDEDCGQYKCANGETVSAEHVRCDGVVDCGDSSDETGCAAVCE
jgi:hypothetical protein